jgi:hypothetical protein
LVLIISGSDSSENIDISGSLAVSAAASSES